MGRIAGPYIDSSNVYHGFLRNPNGQITEWEPPGAGQGPNLIVHVNTINPQGWIVGTYEDVHQRYHAFARRTDGSFIEYEVQGAGTGALQGTTAFDINSERTIIGSFIDDKYVWQGYERAFPNGTITKFDVAGAGKGNGDGTYPPSIDPAGVKIAGFYLDAGYVSHGFLRLP
jgi:hypothetical protein